MQFSKLTLIAWISTGILAWVVLSNASPCWPAVQQPDSLDKRIDQLIQQLGDRDYFVRQRAQADLAKLGFEAFDALSAAENHEDLEIATRAKYLLRLMRVNWTLETDPPEVKRFLEDYESLPADQRLNRMRSLSGLPGGAGLAALCRLVRFEKSPVLAKQAAVEILSRQPPDQPPSAELAETLRKNLGRSRRPGIGWLSAYLRFRDEPKESLDAWIKLVDEELGVLQRTPDQSSPQVATALVRLQINWLVKSGRKQDAVAAMWKLIDLERGDPKSLSELVGWLIEQKAWDAIAQLAERFADRFARDSMLLYTLAQAQAAQGKDKLAEETADRARKLSPGRQVDEVVIHLMSAYHLRERGLFKWAQQEYRYVIETLPSGHQITATAQFGLSEMLHDQGEDLRAGEVLKPLVETIAKAGMAPDNKIAGRAPASIRSRMNHFFALHWGDKGDRQKQREYLEAAVAADPTDVDVLIACYRYPDATAEWKQKTREMIKKAADALRQQIANEPDEAVYYNQFAWLIGNTEGDFEEALKFSRKSLELDPDAGGYYDTLGRVYYGKGDYENAVKYQAKAAELDPHSGLIQKQLKLFQDALEKHKQQKGPPKEVPKEPGGK
jgi:tetratricopeptide (TPR) repeat protein